MSVPARVARVPAPAPETTPLADRAAIAGDALGAILARAVRERGASLDTYGARPLARAVAPATPAPAAAPSPDGAGLTAVHAELDVARAQAAALEKVTDADRHANNQETGKARDDLVSTLKRVRRKIDALKPADAGGTAALESTRAALYRAAEQLAPY